MKTSNQKGFAGQPSGGSGRLLVARLIVVALGFAPLVGAEGAAGETRDYRPASGSLTVATEDTTWTDTSRNRNLPIRIYAPDLKHGNGPFPLVVFSHGGGESREAFGYLGRPLAQSGYIAVFLTHPGGDRQAITDRGLRALGDTSSYTDRPADMRFVLDQLLSATLDIDLLKGRIDRTRIAAAGQCAGSAMCGLRLNLPGRPNASMIDRRFKVCVAVSPQVPFASAGGGRLGLHEQSWKSIDPDVPLLVVTGTKDFRWVPQVRANPDLRRSAYDQASVRDKYLVDIEGAEHNAFTDSVPYYPARERDPRHHGWIAEATIAFLDAYLKKDLAALDWLRAKRLRASSQGQCRQEHALDAKAGKRATATKPEAYDFAPVDAFLEKSLSRMDGGCSLILIQGDQVIYRKAFGTFSTETVVPIASASKWISGGVIMALVDQGTIRLDDKASKYLAEFTGKKGDITIRQMFSHTHGFPDQPTYHRDTRLTLEEAVHKIAEVPLAYDPGRALYYSGLGMQVAGRIAEVATGKPWVEIFKEKIGSPLGMKSTTYYAFGQTKNPNVAGSVETCIDDYGNFVTMVLNRGVFRGKRVLSEEAVKTMLSNQSGDVPIRRHPWQAYIDFDPHMAETPYGIGSWLEVVDAETGKAWRASSGGAFGCQPFVDLKRNVAGVYLPHARTMKRSSSGLPYNDASVVYLELRAILNAIFDGKPVPAVTVRSDPAPQPAEPTDDSELGKQLERIFRFADRDGDGKLLREELPEQMQIIRRAFERLDRDGDGKLSRDELSSGLKAFQRQAPRQKQLVPEDNSTDRREPGSPLGTARRTPDSSPRTGSLYKPDRGPHAVSSVALIELTDTTRNKHLQVRVTYPKSDGRFPVILFSHYSGGTKDDYNELLEYWSSHGYVCIVPNHADSPHVGGERGSQALMGWQDRALDVRFLLDSLGTIEHSAPELKGKLDAKRIGAGGHLIGAHSTGLLAGMEMIWLQPPSRAPACYPVYPG
ncbi:MAG TPA: serine hydrolase [Thermoguttaceae bacterium]|nr:serine hydrolase [Thermoguttaceae bacterium]